MNTKKNISIADFLRHGQRFFLTGLSVDNVIFGFHDNQLKVLLLQSATDNVWMLPGGFIGKDEPLDKAAARVLSERTGLDDIFLQQFHAFGQSERKGNLILVKALQAMNQKVDKDHWALQRFVTIGYYALVEYAKVNPHPDEISLTCNWHNLNELPNMLLDHKDIIEKALEEMRLKLNYQPIGYNLLPKEFTMKNLQSIYETILDRKLDRANFNRKMLNYGILNKRDKHYSGGAHKAPYLYRFNKKKYLKALESGLGGDF